MYSQAEREIFRFDMGDRKVAVDPIAVYRKLVCHPELDLEADLVRTSLAGNHGDGVTKEGYESLDRLVSATRDAFGGIEKFSEDVDGNQSGMLDVEVEKLLADFLLYMADISKKKNPIPTSQEPTESDSDPTTKPMLASG